MFRDSDNIAHIQARLLEVHIDRDANKARKLLKQILHASGCGIDTISVFPAVAKLLATNDLIVKKLASWYVSEHGDHPDFVLLVINTLLKDSRDPNPMIRGLAMKTLSNIPLPSMVEYCTQPITDGLQDGSAYVRRAAVTACAKVHKRSPETVVECGWIDTLYAMIRDNDPVVVANCISVLEDLLCEEGGIIINRKIAHHLLNKLHTFSDWHLLVILKVLRKYSPRSDEETLDIMNIADIHLKSNNVTIVLEVLTFFISLIRNMPHLKSELHNRGKTQIPQFLGSDNSELVYVLLEFIESMMQQSVDYSQHYKSFFCKYNDPHYLKQKKISLLPKLVTPENVRELLEELNMYSTDVSTTVAKSSVRAIGVIANIFTEFCHSCLDRLILLLDLHQQDVMDDILIVLNDLDLCQTTNIEETLETVNKSRDFIETDAGHSAVISILGNYGEHLKDSPYILEDYVNDIETDSSVSLRLALLSATTRLFLKRPAECQDVLGRLMEMCVASRSMEVRDRVFFYYQLLKTDVKEAKKVLRV